MNAPLQPRESKTWPINRGCFFSNSGLNPLLQGHSTANCRHLGLFDYVGSLLVDFTLQATKGDFPPHPPQENTKSPPPLQEKKRRRRKHRPCSFCGKLLAPSQATFPGRFFAPPGPNQTEARSCPSGRATTRACGSTSRSRLDGVPGDTSPILVQGSESFRKTIRTPGGNSWFLKRMGNPPLDGVGCWAVLGASGGTKIWQ